MHGPRQGQKRSTASGGNEMCQRDKEGEQNLCGRRHDAGGSGWLKKGSPAAEAAAEAASPELPVPAQMCHSGATCAGSGGCRGAKVEIVLHVNRALQNAGRGRQAGRLASGKRFSGKPASRGVQQAATGPMVDRVVQGQVSSGSQQSPPHTHRQCHAALASSYSHPLVLPPTSPCK